ncbi:MAG: hypothetical protein EB078_13270, partial [Proteobacteria bacterium]|nr:hypothetical protein [Pseudomonadota bacterium]
GIPWIEPDQIKPEQWALWKHLLVSVPDLSPKRFIASEGLTFLPKKLSEHQVIHKQTKIIEIKEGQKKSAWVILDEKQNQFEGDLLVLALPAPQAFELLSRSGLLMRLSWGSKLTEIEYRPHLVALGKTTASSTSLWELTPQPPFELILDNGRKGVHKSAGLFTAYLDESFSQENFERPEQQVVSEISSLLNDRYQLQLEHLELKRWRYSRTKKALKDLFLEGLLSGPIFFIGDGCANGGFRGALLSSCSLSEYLIDAPGF